MGSRGIVQPFLRMLGDTPDAEGARAVFVPVTSDKGLCGGINSTVCKCVPQLALGRLLCGGML
jgi:F-type H+-transporting ATPase subunit gamma